MEWSIAVCRCGKGKIVIFSSDASNSRGNYIEKKEVQLVLSAWLSSVRETADDFQ